MVAYRLDCRLAAAAAKVGAPYTCYADDLVFNCARTGLDAQNRERHPDFLRFLRGRMGWVSRATPSAPPTWPSSCPASCPSPAASDRLRCYAPFVQQTCFDILSELFARDIDLDLLRSARKKTPTERLIWLEQMQAFADDARKARANEATRAPRSSL